MKVEPGDLLIDKGFNRILTIIDVKSEIAFSIGEYKNIYDKIYYLSSDLPSGMIESAWDYELDAWSNIELVRVSK